MEDTRWSRRHALGTLAALGLGTGMAGFAGAQPAQRAAPDPKVVFENDRVRVVEHRAAPGAGLCGAGTHSHRPHLQVFLADARVRVVSDGGRSPERAIAQGDMLWVEGGSHAVENAGGREAWMYLVEPKIVPAATGVPYQWAALGPDQAGVKVRLQNDVLRVTQHAARPRMGTCGTGMHSHPPHLTILATDSRVRVTFPGEDPVIVEDKAGSVFWDDRSPHAIENVGRRNTKVYLVEIRSA